MLSQQINFNPEANTDCVPNTAGLVGWQRDQQWWKSGGDKLAQKPEQKLLFLINLVHIYTPMTWLQYKLSDVC